ncbi:MAG TPA: FAD-dependent oxidoreductase [Nocardioidaceae bacterium]|jgi:monoamine oxidase
MDDTTLPPAGLTRRVLLGGLGAGGALAASGIGASSPAEAATLQGSLPRRVDVVVVGAGISGLVAARRVARSGRSVLVLEARRRVGGRVLNHELRDGSVVEAGGAFVGPTQDHILALARELGVRTFEEYADGQNTYVAHGVTLHYTGTVPPDPLILPDAAQLIARIDQMSTEVPVDAPWKAEKAQEWDAISVDRWVRENSVNRQVRDVLLSYLQPCFGADGPEISLLFFLWYIATAGNETSPGTFERSAGTRGGAQDSRFVGGSGLIPQRLAHRLGEQVALDAAVRRVRQHDDHVVVTSDRGEVRARRVVVATPPATALAIDWYPLLPPKRMQLLERLPMGVLMKCDAVYRTPFWRDKGLSGMGLVDHGAVRVSFDNSPPDGSVGVLLAFVGGSTWSTYGTMPRERRRRAVLEGFAEIVGPEALHPVEYVEHDWTRERWTKGGPVAVAGCGTTTAYGSTIREPFHRVHWAGTETSTYWSGYMDGAVRAGERAAREVLARL